MLIYCLIQKVANEPDIDGYWSSSTRYIPNQRGIVLYLGLCLELLEFPQDTNRHMNSCSCISQDFG